MKLYYEIGACSLATRIIIHELGLQFDCERVDLKTKKTSSGADFYNLNPKGSVPALWLENSKVITENSAIQQYLAEKYQATHLLPNSADANRIHVLEWLSYITTELHKGCCSPLYHLEVADEVKNAVFRPALKRKLAYVNQSLTNHHYLVADEFTLPDANLFVILEWLPDLDIDLSQYENLLRYYNLLKHRPSIVTSLLEEQV